MVPMAIAAAPAPGARAKAFLAAFGKAADPHLVSWPGQYPNASTAIIGEHFFRDAGPLDRARLARIAANGHEANFDFAAAARWYRTALDGAGPSTERTAAELGLARILAITDPAAAAPLLAELASDPAAAAAATQIAGRIAMTAGDTPAALKRLREAAGLAAAMPSSDGADLLQSITADLSVAAGLGGDIDLAAAYAAASGVGADWRRGYLPTIQVAARCDPARGLGPADQAIFDLAVNKHPTRLVPVWSRRPGRAAAVALLGRALSQWEWQNNADSPPALYRGIRVLVACEETGQPIWPDNDGPRDAQLSWLESHDVEYYWHGDGAAEEQLAATLAALEAAEKRYGIQSLQLVPLLISLSEQGSLPRPIMLANLERAIAILKASSAPPEIIGDLQLHHIWLAGTNSDDEARENVSRALAILNAMPADSMAAIKLRYNVARAQGRLGQDAAAQANIRTILAMPVSKLPANNPVRQMAALVVAGWEDRAKHAAAADALRRQAGQQPLCSNSDDPVRPRGLAIDDATYPKVLRRRLLDGLVRVERHVAANGDTDATRIVYAQPPWLFDKVTLDAFAGLKNDVPRRAGRPMACYSNAQPVRWALATANPDQ